MEEVWRDIEGYEGYYQVSNLGRVKRLESFVYSNVGCRIVRERILALKNERNGYKSVHLCKYGVRTRKRVHRLVAEAFIPNPERLPCVNHKDENTANNQAINLEWCSVAYNNNYGTHQERGLKTRYEKYYKFTKAEKHRVERKGKFGRWKPVIVYRYGTYYGTFKNPLVAEQAVKDFGVNRHNIYYVLQHNVNKEYNGFTFKYIEKWTREAITQGN